MIHVGSPLAYKQVSCLICVVSIKTCKHLLDLITIAKAGEKTKYLEKKSHQPTMMIYMAQSATPLQYVCIKIVYKNECLGGIHYRLGFA